MISRALQTFLYALALGYLVTGAVLFAAPDWSAANFAWKISPFVATTLGGWCLGNASLAAIVARRNHWHSAICPILYLSLFGLFETGVLIAFRERVLFASPLAWIYLATVFATALFAVAALIEAFRQGRAHAVGQRTGATTLVFAAIFILLVGFLGLYGLTAVPGMRGLNAGIFPEVLTPFSLRAFGAFYLALALAVVPLLWVRGRGNVLTHGFAAYGLIVFITAAAFINIGKFDFAARPTQMIYIAIYLLVGTVVGIYLVRYGTGKARASSGG
jgi:hypothetical protein